MKQLLKLVGLTSLAVVLLFAGIWTLMLAAPFSKTARRGLLDLALGKETVEPEA